MTPTIQPRCSRWAPLLAALLVGVSSLSPAQTIPVPLNQLSVFLDCRTNCDGDYLRTEINYVNWLRDRSDAHVHILVTSQPAGGGGEEITIALLGQQVFDGRGDTVRVIVDPTTTADERRQAMARSLALALGPFLVRTSRPRSFRLVFEAERDGAERPQTLPANDPWRSWVFEIEVGTSTDGERNYRSTELELGFSANRTTEEWKSDAGFDFSYDDSRTTVVEYDDQGAVESEETFVTLRRSWTGQFQVVKTLGPRGALGLRGRISSNTFQNQRLQLQLTPAVEYNFFPYSEATRRELSIQYGVGYRSYRYADTTIFGLMEESVPVHRASLYYTTRQPWGSTQVEVEHESFLNDPTKRNSGIDASATVRLFRGFSLNVGGEYRWIRDQVYLRKGQRSPVDVLLRRQALLTGFEYDARISISYTFGSIFNNVVNPRF